MCAHPPWFIEDLQGKLVAVADLNHVVLGVVEEDLHGGTGVKAVHNPLSALSLCSPA